MTDGFGVGRVLLIDADILVYQVASAAEVPIEWDEDFWTLHSDFDAAKQRLDGQIAHLTDRLESADMVFALTTMDRNFRKDIYPLYKSNRKKVRKPLVWAPLRDYLKATRIVFERPGLEGDDCLGILATKSGPLQPGWPDSTEKVLVSIDKDFKTVPCNYYDMNHPEKGVQVITEGEADYWHMYQTLTGDNTDGYPGCPGIGPKYAVKVLEPANLPTGFSVGVAWPKVVAAYVKAGLGEEVAIQQARCARILRACDYYFKEKKPKLWTPPT